MSERITTERVLELVEAATPGPWRNNFNNTNPTIYGSWVDHDGLISADGNGIVWSLFTEADGVLSTHASADNAALIAAAPDLAADLLDARAEIARLTADLAAARELRGVVTAEVHAAARLRSTLFAITQAAKYGTIDDVLQAIEDHEVTS